MIRLAISTEPHSLQSAYTAFPMFKARKSTETELWGSHTPRPMPEPNPEPNPEPDAAVSVQHSALAQDDWDQLFHAVVARLQACAGADAFQQAPDHRLGMSASLQVTVQECVVSLNWLHAALLREREQQKQLQKQKQKQKQHPKVLA